MTETEAIALCDEGSKVFMCAAIYATAGYVLSLRYGTPEMAVAYAQLAGRHGVLGVSFAMAKKWLTGELPMPVSQK